MKLDLEAYERAAEEGTLTHDWRHCMLAVAVGADSLEGCVTKGWPRWLAEAGVLIFDRAPRVVAEQRGEEFLRAVLAGQERGVDWDEVFRQWRLDSILPIALESIGEGEEDWRIACREAVQWSIDNGGVANVKAARAAAADSAWAEEAASAKEAAGAARADAWERMEQSLYAILRGER